MTLTPTADNDWYRLAHKVSEERIKIVFAVFREHGIEPILIKGWAAARLYPKPWERYSSDIDLAVSPDQFTKARSLVKLHPQTTLDIHRGLRHLDTADWNDLFANSRLITIKDNDQKSTVRILSEEDHLRVLCVHWLQDGGAYQHRLQDVYYAVSRRNADFSWDRCLQTVSEKRRIWIICVIGLAHYYLDLSLDDLPFREAALNVPVWIRRTVEREWRENIKLVPLANSLGSRRDFFRQLKKRFPPNPIQATIDVNGSFNNTPRIVYQFGSIAWRLIGAGRRLYRTGLEKMLPDAG